MIENLHQHAAHIFRVFVWRLPCPLEHSSFKRDNLLVKVIYWRDVNSSLVRGIIIRFLFGLQRGHSNVLQLACPIDFRIKLWLIDLWDPIGYNFRRYIDLILIYILAERA